MAYEFFNPIPGLNTFTGTTGRIVASPAITPGERIFVGVIEGQSLASSHCQSLYQPSAKVQCVNVLGDRLLYEHREPMMGGSYYENGYADYFGGYGSVWGEVGDLLISSGKFDRVIWCNVSYGGQFARDLAPGGQLGHRLPLAFRVLQDLGISADKVSAVVSMLGESDGSGTSAADFKSYRTQSIQTSRNLGFTGPWFIPLETYSFGTMSNVIRGAQLDLASEVPGVITGPDFDTLDASYRYTQAGGAASVGNGKVHPNEAGLHAIAQMWADTIAANF